MIYLLDSNVFSDLMHDRADIRLRFGAISPTDPIRICTIVRGEVLFGLQRMPDGKRRQDLEREAAKLFKMIPCEPIPVSVADRYSSTKRSRQRAGLPMDENDLWIAATALALGATLVTRDSDFQKVAGLASEDLTK